MQNLSDHKSFLTEAKAESWTLPQQLHVIRLHFFVLYGPIEPLFLGAWYSDRRTEIPPDKVLHEIGL